MGAGGLGEPVAQSRIDKFGLHPGEGLGGQKQRKDGKAPGQAKGLARRLVRDVEEKIEAEGREAFHEPRGGAIDPCKEAREEGGIEEDGIGRIERHHVDQGDGGLADRTSDRP